MSVNARSRGTIVPRFGSAILAAVLTTTLLGITNVPDTGAYSAQPTLNRSA
jgi:hypothetical protein